MDTTTLVFDAIGTEWIIEIFAGLDDDTSQALQRMILRRIDEFDTRYSRFSDDSLVSRMSHKAGSYLLPDDAKPLLDLYGQLYKITEGNVTPLIGQTMEQSGYDAQYSLRPKTLTPPPAWDDVLGYDFPNLTLNRPVLLDFGAAGKGYLADIISELLLAQGITEFCVNAGGDIVCRTPAGKTVDVALEHPGDANKAIGVAHITNQSLCGSAGNRRKWGKFHHIISPKTLESPRHIAAIWVAAGTGLVADGLATALYFVEPSKLMQHFDFEYALVRADYSLDVSPGFPADFFTSSDREKLE